MVVATASWAPRGGSKGQGVDRTATGAALGCGGRTPLERSTGGNESTFAASASSSAIMASTTASHRRAASITSESTDCDRRRCDVGLGLFIPRGSGANVSAASSALAESAVGAAVANLIPRRRVFNTDRHTQRHAHKTRTRQTMGTAHAAPSVRSTTNLGTESGLHSLERYGLPESRVHTSAERHAEHVMRAGAPTFARCEQYALASTPTELPFERVVFQ